MAIRTSIAVGLMVCLSAGGCVTHVKPHTVETLRKQYVAAYDKLNPGQQGDVGDYGRALFQQAFPRADGTRVVWFLRSLSDGSKTPPEVSFTSEEDGKALTHSFVPLDDKARVGLVMIQPRSGLKYREDQDWQVVLRDPGGTATQMTLRHAPGNGSGPMNFVAYSCNRPYSQAEDPKGITSSNVNSLNLLRKLAEAKSDLARPSFLVGLGDQIYVDPDPQSPDGYSLFFGDESQEFRFEVGHGASELLNEVYRAHFAIPPLDRAFRSVPSVMMWDDHDIVDGWGVRDNQKELQSYFGVARQKFWEFQASRNPETGRMPQARPSEDFDVQFDWGPRIRVYVVDSRNSRGLGDKNTYRMFSDGQKERLKRWFEEANVLGDQDELLVLALPTPLGACLTWPGRVAGTVPTSEKEDINDTFCSERNAETREWLSGLIQTHFGAHEKHQLLVLSGDVHESGLMTYVLSNGGKSRVIGYEVVTSGISNTRRAPRALLGLANAMTPIGMSDSGLRVFASGAVSHVPAFAQIFVEQSPLRVSVVFHASGESRRGSWPWSSPYEEASLANPSSRFDPDALLADDPSGTDWFPGWANYRADRFLDSGGGHLMRVPLRVGSVEKCRGRSPYDWPRDRCGQLPYEEDTKTPRTSLHPLSVRCAAVRHGQRIRQHEPADDWINVFRDGGLECESSESEP